MKLLTTITWLFLMTFTLTSCAVEKMHDTTQAASTTMTHDTIAAIDEVVFAISGVTASADMMSRHAHQVKTLRELKVTLLTIKAKGILLSVERTDLFDHLKLSVVPELKGIIIENKKMISMGQLDIKRVIEPSLAIAENNRLNDLIEKIKHLISQLQ